MFWKSEEKRRTELNRKIYAAMDEVRIDDVRPLLVEAKEKGWLEETPLIGSTWMNIAADTGSIPLMETMLDLGFDIDAYALPDTTTALCTAIHYAHFDLTEHLLKRGADPNIGRLLIAAMNCDEKSLVVPFVTLLIEHGVDVNKSFDLYGDQNNRFTALDWASKDEEVADLLRAAGAKKQKELNASSRDASAPKELSAFERSIEERFGPIDARGFFDIVPSEIDVRVRIARDREPGGPITLFTEGLSSAPMRTPKGKEAYRYAELFMQLPCDWPIGSRDPAHLWPVRWLEIVGQHPHKTKSWLGGPLTVFANGEPPQSLSPGLPFTCLLLLAQYEAPREDGQTVQLFRVLPLYTEERELEKKHGAAALMRALDRKKAAFVVDLKRANAVG